jgi:hypothetical protein
MSGGDTKDIGYAAWKDPYAWMEPMKGARWNALVGKENETFERAVRAAASSPEEVEAVAAAFVAAEEEAESKREWIVERGDTKLRAVPQGGGAYAWSWAGSTVTTLAGDLDIGTKKYIVYTRLKGTSGQQFEVVAQRGERVLWKHSRVGPPLALLHKRVYFLEESAPLRFDRLVSVDAETGKGRRVLYTETCRLAMLSLVRGESQCLFLLSDNSGRQALYRVQEDRVERLCEEGISFVPVGSAAAEPEFLYQTSFDGPWILSGSVLSKWRKPPVHSSVEGAHLGAGLLILKRHGRRSIWMRGQEEVHSFLGEVEMHPWKAWHGGSDVEMLLTSPGAPSVRAVGRSGRLRLETPIANAAGRIREGVAKSADGTPVHWAYVWNANFGKSPRALMVIVYGAYNEPTGLSTARWRPYLERGWAIGFAFVRGGGDHTPAWAEAGRREGKSRGVDDFVACVRGMREAGGFAAEDVCVYGRSAGGYIIGTAVARHPAGDLFGAAYTEVPYVDVLNTTVNAALPLTEYEYLEFGNPRERIRDLEYLVRESPVQALGPKGAPGVFVVCRTALDDMQVFAYESAKWIQALRGGDAPAAAGEPKLLAITAGEGHHARGQRRIIERTEDFLLVSAWLGGGGGRGSGR